jgi:hypothetical protein
VQLFGRGDEAAYTDYASEFVEDGDVHKERSLSHMISMDEELRFFGRFAPSE